ncbi:MAG TPA: UDP-N-acetylmuramoyl-L-alanyl-D-glutamate--2,6-diaminopimelate ligase [Tepidisphaeraceae bacterium]|nr:UDP-N-acetylmuramoyl-L-alanyl-D-glutamate--2,6-diaminopimelate ligase [Tepidisphaeraceae bacterium]
MLLRKLISQFDSTLDLAGVPDLEILGIKDDSRQVHKGDLFIARPGRNTDGWQFITDAAAKGAVAVVTETSIDTSPLPQILVKDAAAASSILANIYFGDPSKKLKVLGVTGTNGKTTTTYLIRHLLQKNKQRCGMIGTVETDDGASKRESEMTTPGAVHVAELLSAMRNNSCRACAIETSSHALHQQRVIGVKFAAAGFTNLTGDHLDYHKEMSAYADAKAKLFEGLAEDAVAVVNADDAGSARMKRDCQARIVTFGIKNHADYRAQDIAITSSGTKFILVTPDGRAEVSMILIGRHNIENALCAAAMVGEAFGLTVHQIAAGLRDAQGAPGRLQAVRIGQPFAVLVDYAHTDDAMANVLSALRPLTRGSLRILFGCGGDRDRTKRPRMARTAITQADAVYITSDNPRTENPSAIIDEIVAGIPQNNRKPVIVEPDRHKAIERILSDAQPNDVILLAGKGHENYQIIGKTKNHFDDVEEATRAIKARLALV